MSQQITPNQRVQATINKLTGGTDFQQGHVRDLHGKVAVITGGTGGIGYEVSKALALAGCRVVALSRKQEHGDETLGSLREAAAKIEGHSGQIDFKFVACDFGELKTVKEVADSIARDEPRIDILINDAGIGVSNYALDADGIERIFGVNVLGHYLFINRLLPTLRRTRAQHNVVPRLINLTSNMHALAPSSCRFESLEELNQPNLRADQYYERSKLAIILYTKSLVSRASLAPDQVVVLSVHPGAVSTEIQDQFQQAFGETLGKVIKYLQTPLMRSPEEGSLGTLWCAVSPEVEEMMRGGEGGEGKLEQGAYVTDPGKAGGETAQAQDMQLAENVWNLCEKLVREKLGGEAMYKWDEGA
ncbi:NAD(P)-binding protein [Exidia glandulosa HHB12029]|uniref:NAD(P)-binding protein n=1 Tax=Exidia glandulosa HHB12029 TaxID=1314781 RepID=A0A165HT24_EXIGL|nr:NAD(P)-binding protein [Exidia glandulosa HHB12029]